MAVHYLDVLVRAEVITGADQVQRGRGSGEAVGAGREAARVQRIGIAGTLALVLQQQRAHLALQVPALNRHFDVATLRPPIIPTSDTELRWYK